MRRLMMIVVAGLGALLMGGCAEPGPELPQGTQKISGTVTVTDQSCPEKSPRPYPVSQGTAVAVVNAEGEIVAQPTLSAGESPPDPGLRQCVFPFVVEGVPEDSASYAVRIGDDSRLVEQFSPDELAAPIRFFL